MLKWCGNNDTETLQLVDEEPLDCTLAGGHWGRADQSGLTAVASAPEESIWQVLPHILQLLRAADLEREDEALAPTLLLTLVKPCFSPEQNGGALLWNFLFLCSPGLISPTGWRPLEGRNHISSHHSMCLGVFGVYCTKPHEDIGHICSTYYRPSAQHILGAL